MEFFKDCKTCKDRYVGCHAVCEKYITAKMKRDVYTQTIKDMEQIDRLSRKGGGREWWRI